MAVSSVQYTPQLVLVRLRTSRVTRKSAAFHHFITLSWQLKRSQKYEASARLPTTTQLWVNVLSGISARCLFPPAQLQLGLIVEAVCAISEAPAPRRLPTKPLELLGYRYNSSPIAAGSTLGTHDLLTLRELSAAGLSKREDIFQIGPLEEPILGEKLPP